MKHFTMFVLFGHSKQFLGLLGPCQIVLSFVTYQYYIVCYVIVEKTPYLSLFIVFFKENNTFWHKNPFLIFFGLEFGKNKYQIPVLHPF